MKLYRFAEYDAKALYYHNDVSQQIASILLAEKKEFVKPADFPTTIAWASAAYADIEKRIEEDASFKTEKEKIQLRIADTRQPESKRAEKLTLGSFTKRSMFSRNSISLMTSSSARRAV